MSAPSDPVASAAAPEVASLSLPERLLWKAWRVFKSLKTGIFLLGMIGLVSVYGTMGFASNAALGDQQIPLARYYVFNAWWFALLLMVFGVQLVVSTWHVTVMSVTIWSKREFKRALSFFRPAVGAPRAEVTGIRDAAAADAIIRKAFTRAHEDGSALFAHRGLLSRIGPTIIHAGMITVLLAGLVRVVLVRNGYIMAEGVFTAAEGETSGLIFHPIVEAQKIGGSNIREIPIPEGRLIRVLDFDAEEHPNVNTPSYFSSLVEVVDSNTGRAQVFQLDMNHSMNIGGLQFHQSGYQQVEEASDSRFNFDIRERATGRRIAIVDATPGQRVRIGTTDYHFRVSGVEPGSRWQVSTRANPTEPIASGTVRGATTSELTYQVDQFYPNFYFDKERNEPATDGNEPDNPVARITTFLDGKRHTTELAFLNPELQREMPSANERYKFLLTDVKVPVGEEQIDWSVPGSAQFQIAVVRAGDMSAVTTADLFLNERSAPVAFEDPAAASAAPSEGEGNFEVLALGPAPRFVTILSVVREPTVPWSVAGVGLMFIGALMTFMFRYEALYGLWDRGAGTLRLALVPRWGRSADASRVALQELIDRIAAQCGGTARILEPGAKDAPPPPDDDETSIVQPQVATHA